jgi:tetratricopeptide (TPR) repeat protein
VRRHPALVLAAVSLLALAGYILGRRHYGQYHLAAARRALAIYHFQEAREHLAVCRRLWPKDADVAFLAARTARRAGDLKEAAAILSLCEELRGTSDELTLEWALLRVQAGDLPRSVEDTVWARLREREPEAPLILEALIQGYLYSYRLGHALDCAERLLGRQPENVRALLWRGWIREGMHEPEAARKDYRRVLARDADCDEARLHLAEMLIPRRPREAAKHFERLRQKKPTGPEILLGLARCRRRLGQAGEARQLLDAVLQEQPRSAGALREIGRLELAEKKPAEAEPWLRRAVAIDPHDPETCYDLFRCLSLLGRKTEAARYEARSRRLREDFERLWYLGQKIGQSPRDADLRYQAGVICVRNGQSNEAERWFRGALQIDPGHHLTHRALADIYKATGKADLAAQHRRLGEPAAIRP